MQPGTPRFLGGETAIRPNIDTFRRFFDFFRMILSRNVVTNRERSWRREFFLSLYLALVYIKPVPELGLALPPQRKKLSDVMVADS